MLLEHRVDKLGTNYYIEFKYFEFKTLFVNTTRKYGKKASLALNVWVKLARAFTTFNNLTQKDIRRYGLTQSQFGVIECLGHLGPMTTGELCKKYLVSGGNMTCVLDNLEAESLVERVRSRKDRRAIVVQLTAKGQKLFKQAFIQHAEFVAKIVSVLGEEEQQQLGELLKKLGLALQEQ